MNIVLEGGGLELERALAEYRALRRLVEARWERRAVAVVDLCDALEAREEQVEEATRRALRRMRQDRDARVVGGLVDAVTTERARLMGALDAALPARPRPPGLIARVAELEQLAREEAHFQLAWRSFDAQRLWLSVAAGACAVSAPLGSWWWASDGGWVPTLFDLSTLFDGRPAWFAAASALVLLVLVYLRASSWDWLGVRLPAAATAFFAGVGVFGGMLASSAPMVPCLGFGLLAGLATASAQVLWALWVPREVPAEASRTLIT